MSVYEDFTSLMEGWEGSGMGLLTQSDDQGQGLDLYSTDVKDRMPDVFSEVLKSPTSDTDAFAESWMEQTSLSQMLEELTGMAMDAQNVPSAPVVKEIPVPGFENVDSSIFSDMGLDDDGFELLQQLVEKATEVDSDILSTDQSQNKNSSLEYLSEVTPVISLNDSGISSLNTSLEDISTIDLTDMDDVAQSPSSILSDCSDNLSSGPVSPSSSVSSSDYGSSELYKLMIQPTHKSLSHPYNSSTPIRKSKVKSSSSDANLETHFLSKKEKKKLQNKNAAIRYRQKKKAEADEIRTTEDDLEDKNKLLHDKVDELQREILYMKNLMGEVCKARGVSIS